MGKHHQQYAVVLQGSDRQYTDLGICLILSCEAWATIRRTVSVFSSMHCFTSTEVDQAHGKQDTGCLLGFVDS